MWLDRTIEDPKTLIILLIPFPADSMEAYPVSTLVNSPRNEKPEVIGHELENVREDVHIQGIENCWSLLKRGLKGVFHHVGQDYLEARVTIFLCGLVLWRHDGAA